MIHDQRLLDRLSGFPAERFSGEVFRATRVDADPIAPSISGGRWAPPPEREGGVAVLYTSVDRDGAVAEVAAFLTSLNPIPRSRPLSVTRIAVTLAQTVRLTRADLESLGVDWSRYGERDYGRTQLIGAALAFLGFDGLIAPSARWACDNLMIFSDNHQLAESLEPIAREQIDWRAWARDNGMIAEGG